jgi:hypothetical protein
MDLVQRSNHEQNGNLLHRQSAMLQKIQKEQFVPNVMGRKGSMDSNT